METESDGQNNKKFIYNRSRLEKILLHFGDNFISTILNPMVI